MPQIGSLAHYVSRMAVRRDVPSVWFDDDLSIIANQKRKEREESQIGLTDTFIEGHAKRKVRSKKWRESNRDYIKQYRARKHDRLLELQRAWQRNNPDKVRAQQNRYREKHREKYNAYQLQWLNKNRERVRERQNARRAERYETDQEFKERKKAINREAYHRAKQKIIDEIGLDGWKLQQKQLREKRKNDKSSKG